jgi:DNA-binding transcriptional ArsR family regulator
MRGEVVLIRVNFTPDDVARTKFGVAPAPLGETVLAMVELRRAAASRGRVRSGGWLRDAWKAFPPTARPLLDLLGPNSPWPDFLSSVAPDLDDGLEEVRATPPDILRADLSHIWRDRPGRPPTWVRSLARGDREAVDLMVRALRDLHDAIVAPQWDSVLVAFHADVARRIMVLGAGGHEALFGTLHPQLRWRRDGLERAGVGTAVELRGDGILLMPSAFWTGEPKIIVTGFGRPSILFYPAQPNGQLAAKDCLMADAAARDSLAALIGPTRASVLRALREPRGTADLAGTARISPASASEHAKVLRDAYLIETRREGRTVRHSLTPLGRTILGQLPIPTAAK